MRSDVRADAVLKVRGAAPYVADHYVPGMAHAVLVRARIARGSVRLDTAIAETAPGVLGVLTHENAPRLHADDASVAGRSGERLLPLQDGTIHYWGQPLAVVVARTLEQAEYAASQVSTHYHMEVGATDWGPQAAAEFPEAALGEPLQDRRGDPEAGLARARTRHRARYAIAWETHNPIEASAALALWEGDQLTLYDTTQGVLADAAVVAHRLGLKPQQVTILCPYVGGGFGCKGFVWHQGVLAALAARLVGCPVKLVLSRAQMFTSGGHRGPTLQELDLGADVRGVLTGAIHRTRTTTSVVDNFLETSGLATRLLYACPNLGVSHELVPLNMPTPGPMRAPGKASGLFALESALDELAYRLNLDPLELRLRNYADHDPRDGRPWSSKELRACYRLGAERFGWSRRPVRPGMTREGHEWIGWGMASATFPAYQSPAGAALRLLKNGHVEVRVASHDLGTGTYTVLAGLVSDVLGVAPSAVTVLLGDSRLPKAPVSGGSQTVASVGPAVHQAALGLRGQLEAWARADVRSPLHQHPAALVAAPGGLATRDGRFFDAYADILERQGKTEVAWESSTTPTPSHGEYSFQSFGAQFIEVAVDPDLGQVRVRRALGVFDCGRILNRVTTRAQLAGGMIWGIGMALTERTVTDRGRVLTDNLADYLVPVQGDIPDIEIEMLNVPDPHVNALGARGVGEIGITGTAAAVANAVFHATGRRIRELPIRVEHWM